MASREKNNELKELLHKMRKTELTDFEWSRIRTLGSSDPFLIDAIEGLQLLPQEERIARIQFIETSLNNLLVEKSKKRRVILQLGRIAAAMVLMIGVWAIWQAFPDQKETLTMHKIGDFQDASDALETNDALGTVEQEVTQEALLDDVEKDTRAVAQEIPRELEEHPTPESDQPVPIQNDKAIQTQSTHDDLKLADISNAKLEDKSSDTSKPGDLRRQSFLSNDAASNMRTAVEEKNQGPRQVSYALATPIGGWKSYYKYIRNNIMVPVAAKDSSIVGTVYLEFDLKEDGSPHNFRITQSLGYGCDEEATRLVREGPKWDVKKAQVPIGSLSVDF